MSVRVTCPGCGAVYSRAENLHGKNLRCKQCQRVFVGAAPKPQEEEPLDADEDLALRRRVRPIASIGCRDEQDYHGDFFRDNLGPARDKDGPPPSLFALS